MNLSSVISQQNNNVIHSNLLQIHLRIYFLFVSVFFRVVLCRIFPVRTHAREQKQCSPVTFIWRYVFRAVFSFLLANFVIRSTYSLRVS